MIFRFPVALICQSRSMAALLIRFESVNVNNIGIMLHGTSFLMKNTAFISNKLLLTWKAMQQSPGRCLNARVPLTLQLEVLT